MKLVAAIGVVALVATACSDTATTTPTSVLSAATTTTALPATTATTAPTTTTTLAPSAADPVEIEALEFRQEVVDDPPLQLNISTPRLIGSPDAAAQTEINQYLLDIVTRAEQAFVRDVALYLEESPDAAGPVSTLDLYFDVRTLTQEILSMRFDEVAFFQGAARPTQSVLTFNVDLTTGQMLDLEDLFIGTEWAFALDFLVREAVTDQLYNGDAAELDAWVEPDDLLIPEDFALGPGGFEFSFQEVQVASAVFGAPTVTVPYSSIGVYLDPDGLVGGVASAATETCEALVSFQGTVEGVFTADAGSDVQAYSLAEARTAASELRRLRPDLNDVIDVLLGWATAYSEGRFELTQAEMDAIEVANDNLDFESSLCG